MSTPEIELQSGVRTERVFEHLQAAMFLMHLAESVETPASRFGYLKHALRALMAARLALSIDLHEVEDQGERLETRLENLVDRFRALWRTHSINRNQSDDIATQALEISRKESN